MGLARTTRGATEADLEARAGEALRAVLPWINTDDIKHQLTFSFKLGHKSVIVDGSRASRRQGRLDILVERGEVPLAVLELKKPESSLTQDDFEQGLSYARVLHPRPPIVVVSNGTETRVFATHDGAELGDGVASEQALVDLMQGALSLAQADLRKAIATLMGPASDVWMAAVRAASELTIEELTGGWNDHAPTFTSDFHIPRKATKRVREALEGPRRVVAVEGAPLSGKSHVLRELTLASRNSEDVAVLFLEASGSAATGIADEVARVLGAALGWRIDNHDARRWLETLGKNAGPMLVIAVDALGLEHQAVRSELEALSARSIGTRLKFVVEADTSVIDRLWHGETGRKETPFARRGVRLSVDRLDDDEFDQAVRVLARNGVTLMPGADKAPEYRQSWLLRSIAASVSASPEHEQGLVAVLPPLLSLDLFGHVRTQFVQDQLCGQAATYARAALDDYGRDDRPHEVVLRGAHTFMVRMSVIREHADASELAEMAGSGLVGTVFDGTNRRIVTGRIPELIASELARLLAAELYRRMGSGRDGAVADAADWLVGLTSSLPMGDVIAAQAIVDLAQLQDGVSIDFVNRLLELPPEVRQVRPGTRGVAWLPDIGRVDLHTREDGVTVLKMPGWPNGVEIPPEEGGQTYANLGAWLILSHVAGLPLGAISSGEDGDNQVVGLLHPAILALVGTCPFTLRRVPENVEESGLLAHDRPGGLSLVCHSEGIVEPVTFSLLKFLEEQREQADDWLGDACDGGSVPLLHRVSIVLRQLEAMKADENVVRWANARRQEIESALNGALATV